ncbi:unnamed protein product, partial [Tetraodon nigroviridis]
MATIPELIRTKRDGRVLSDEDIGTFVRAVTSGSIQEAQIGAMLMAIWKTGMTEGEIQSLTREMMSSGEVMSWPRGWDGLVVDKHSTGGVGDKVPMISGRGLAHTGGTLDKLESVPGFNVHQTAAQVKNAAGAAAIRDILASVGCCIVGQSRTLVPADWVLYAAGRHQHRGQPAAHRRLHHLQEGRRVAGGAGAGRQVRPRGSLQGPAQRQGVNVGNGLGIRTGAVLSRMDAVIGRCVGNSLEVMEALETLKGRGPDDLMELVATLGN